MTVRIRGGRFMLDVRHRWPDGRVERIRIAVPDNMQSSRKAEAFERQVLADLRVGIDPRAKEAPDPQRVNPLTYAEHWQTYFAEHAKAHDKASTLDSKRSIYEHHLGPFFGSMRLDQIGPRQIDRFKAGKLEMLHAKTINNCLTVLRHSLDVAAKWDLLPAAPRVEWLRAPKPAFRFLDFDEAERLVDAAASEPEWQVMIILALNTGMRLGELLALRWDAVDLKAGRVIVRQAVARGIIGTPKSHRQREIPLNATATAALQTHRHLRGDLVFCQEDGSMLTKNGCKWPLRRAQRKAGITALGWHDLRHTFASHLVMRGVPLKAVQELLGHATIEMTMRYAHLSPTVKHDAVAVLDRPSGGHILGTVGGRKAKSAP